MKNYIESGDVVTLPAPAAVSSGDLVAVGKLHGVAQTNAESGADVALATRGVFELPKASAQAWTVGAKIYWDGTECTTTATSNTLIGCAMAVAANPSATGIVRLNGTVV